MRPHYETNHTFAICAFGDSPYLEQCIRSLIRQSVPTNIILCTSTPSPYLDEMADRYGIPLCVREGESSICDDWNFAYDTARTQYVTLAHQDDAYDKNYTRVLFDKREHWTDMSIFFSAYRTIKDGRVDSWERSSLVKKALCLPVSLTPAADSRLIKRSCLVLGNGISCPMTTYNKNMVGDTVFHSHHQFVLDWETYLRFADMPGRFVYSTKPLGYFRIHDQATTRRCIDSQVRAKEDWSVFRRLWPESVAKVIMRLYRSSYTAYES